MPILSTSLWGAILLQQTPLNDRQSMFFIKSSMRPPKLLVFLVYGIPDINKNDRAEQCALDGALL
jgi:hypothetical protein